MASRDWSRYASVYEPIAVGSIDGSDTQPHDNAIVRALHSTHVPNGKLTFNPKHTLFVGRLHPKVTDKELDEIFSPYGKLKYCKVIRDIVTGQSRRYGFVEYSDDYSVSKAYRELHRKIVRGTEILVDHEFGRTMKGWKPRSLGGGFGGRRESGQLRFGCRDRPWERPIVLSKPHRPPDRR